MTTTPGLFREPKRMMIPSELAGWNAEQLRAGLVSSARVGDWEAVHRVMCALVGRSFLGVGPLRELAVVALGTHSPQRMYRDCGHNHEENDDGTLPEGVFWMGDPIEDYICEKGYDATVCDSCGMGEDGESLLPHGAWPCATFRPLSERLVQSLEATR